jgi:hypothetical protein
MVHGVTYVVDCTLLALAFGRSLLLLSSYSLQHGFNKNIEKSQHGFTMASAWLHQEH